MQSLARLPSSPASLFRYQNLPQYDKYGYRKRSPGNLAWVSVVSKSAYCFQDTDFPNNSRSYTRQHKVSTTKLNLEVASITTSVPLRGSDKGVVLIKQS